MIQMPTRPQSIGGTLDRSFKLYFAAFKQSIWIALISSICLMMPSIAVDLAQARLLPGGIALIPAIIFYIVGYCLAYGGLVWSINEFAEGRTPTTWDCVCHTAKCLLRLLGGLVLYYLILVGAAIPIGIVIAIFGSGLNEFSGFIMLSLLVLLASIPIMYVAVSLFFFMPGIVVDDLGVIESLNNSFRIVTGNWWRAVCITTVILIVYFVAFMTVTGPGVLIDWAVLPEIEVPLATRVASMIASTFLVTLLASAILAVYHEIKLRRQGRDLDGRIGDLALPEPRRV